MKIFNHILSFLPLLTAAALTTAACSDKDNPDDPVPDHEVRPVAAPGPLAYRVLEYRPAPGQFINEIPAAQARDTYETVLTRLQQSVDEGNLFSLGAFGGYAVIAPEKRIANTPGADFRILGNAFWSYKSDDGTNYGSSEPGIVYVMTDTNGDGLPNDGEWIELWGDHTEESTMATVIYSQQPEVPASGEAATLTAQIEGGETLIWKSLPSLHNHSYFPLWLTEVGEITVSGRMLPPNGFIRNGRTYILESYSGYADSAPNGEAASALDLDAARDSEGKPVEIESIDFIKVVSGVLQINGPLGECSTEIRGLEVL